MYIALNNINTRSSFPPLHEISATDVALCTVSIIFCEIKPHSFPLLRLSTCTMITPWTDLLSLCMLTAYPAKQ